MGLDKHGFDFLQYAKNVGVNFTKTATLGRQFIDVEHGCEPGWSIFSEPFFGSLGAKTIDSFDISDYEGANQKHDFNLPIPEEFHRRYTVFIDLGGLEHIFNIKMALKNCMEMLELGGHFISVAPANNFLAHGLYQLQPDLFYRVFDFRNGFTIKSMFFAKIGDPVLIEVADIDRKSAELVNGPQPLYAMVLAQRVEYAKLFEFQVYDGYYLRDVWKT